MKTSLLLLLAGAAPEPRVWQLDEAMQAVTDAAELVDHLWRVAPDGGVASCVVTLRPLGATPPPEIEAVDDALFAKVGAGYEPRVLLVPAGSTVLLRNANSPCNGFVLRPRKNQNVNAMLTIGREKRVSFERAELIPVQCDLREEMRGAIVVVDTAAALTDATGSFRIEGLAPGRYAVALWHESLGRRALDRGEIELEGGAVRSLGLQLRAP